MESNKEPKDRPMKLPTSVVTFADVSRLLRELENVEGSLLQLKVRGGCLLYTSSARLRNAAAQPCCIVESSAATGGSAKSNDGLLRTHRIKDGDSVPAGAQTDSRS